MQQTHLNSLLKSFCLSQEELDSRVVLDEFAHSIADLVVDEFAQNYLINNPELSIYLAHTNSARLLKNIKEFVVFVLSAPVNEAYVKRIYSIGEIHFSIKLDPAKVSYGFWAINEVLNKLSEVNSLVKEHKSLVSKVLRLVEHLMVEGYYLQEAKEQEYIAVEKTSSSLQNDLYVAFQVHKQHMQRIEKSIEEDAVTSVVDKISESADMCGFGKILNFVAEDERYKSILGSDLDDIIAIHVSWHEEFIKFKNAHKEKNLKQMKTHQDNIIEVSAQLSSRMDSAIEDTLNDGHALLNSGVESIRNMANLFKDKNAYGDFDVVFESLLREALSNFNWAVDTIFVSNTSLDEKGCHIVKMFRHQGRNVYVGVHLKDEHVSVFVKEIIIMLLEMFEMHFIGKEREESLIMFADKAEHANRSKDMFLANMSHELRTPLNAITGFSQIILMKKDTPDILKNYVEKINIAGKHLLDLVNTILDFAKLEAGKMQFSPKLSNISVVLNEVKSLISPLAQKKNISLEFSNIVSLNLYIDEKLFKQVLLNLLSNAIKFTHDEGKISLNISYDMDLHTHIFEVEDNGIGIDEESVKKLFQPFYQVENSYQKDQQGTGLGLMLSKKIIEDLHQGKMWVESIEGKGSKFCFSMPTSRMQSTTYKVEEAPKNSRRALVVEDSSSYQKILTEHLKEKVTLTFTDSVNKAKGLLTEETYDFVILDFFLIDGISTEVLIFMEEESIQIPTIVISAEEEMDISSSLSGFTNLEGIMNKTNIDQICASIRGEAYQIKDT